jgi:Flp pilus assembly protein TadD
MQPLRQKSRNTFGLATVLLLGTACIPGCSSAARPHADGYQTVARDPRRDAEFARRENARAVALMDKADDSAEAALKSALDADIMCGPAHNNLGTLYYRQHKLYLAAWEFQYATKLMPDQSEPPNNLGMVFEAVGKLDEAADSYGKALALAPENVQAMGNLARAKVRRGDHDADVRALLERLVLRDDRTDWLAWEKKTLARLDAVRADLPRTEPADTTRPQ